MVTRGEARAFMMGYVMARLAVRSKELEAEGIRSAIHRITQTFTDGRPSHGGGENGTEKMLVGYLLIQEQLKEEMMEAVRVRERVADVVEAVKEARPFHGAVLECRYLSRMGEQEIADDLGYSKARIQQVSAEALDEVARILSSSDAE